MSKLFNTLRDVLAPYANKINLHTEEIDDLQDDVSEVKDDLGGLDNDVSDLKSHVDTIANNIFAPLGANEESITSLFNVAKLNYNLNPPVTNKCVIAPNQNYNSYYFEVAENQTIYFGDLSALTYIALGVVTEVSDIHTDSAQQISFVGESARRARKSENNMPTEANPVALNSGDVCIVTIPTSVNASAIPVYVTVAGRSDTLLNNNIELNTHQIEQTRNKGFLQYVNDSGNDASTERLNVFMPTYTGYIKYEFLHSVNVTNNCDVWRIGRAYHVDNSLNNATQLTTSGEWECAIKLTDRSDFAGGYGHGDEIFTDLTVYVDGVSVDVSTLIDILTFEDLKIIQHSNLYDPDDSSTIFAQHGSCHKFSTRCENNLEIEQSIKWLTSYNLMPSYLAMFPPLKTTTEKIFNDVGFKEETITIPQTLSNVRSVTLSKESIDFSCVFGITDYPDVDSLSGTFFITDNSGQSYNKCYYYACGNNASVVSGSVWKSKTIYNLVVGH